MVNMIIIKVVTLFQDHRHERHLVHQNHDNDQIIRIMIMVILFIRMGILMNILTYLVRHLMVTLLPFFTATLPSAGSLTTCLSFGMKDLIIKMMTMITMINHDEDAHPGGQKDVKPVGNRNGEVAVCLDLTIVLAPVVHLCFIKIILNLIIRIFTSSWLMTRLFPLSWSLMSLLTIMLPAVNTRGPWAL